MAGFLIPRVPDDDDKRRHERAHDRIRDLLNDLIRSGVLVPNPAGTWTINQEFLNEIINEFIESMGDDGDDVTFLEGNVNQCKNALRFLGVEPNEFPTKDKLPQE